MSKILIIQTAFLGDVILATSLIETLKSNLPEIKIDFLLRKGNEDCIKNNPHIDEVLIWNKKEAKFKSLSKLIRQIRAEQYDCVINVQRFATMGVLTALSKSKSIGFSNNPFSFCFTHKVKHLWGNKHEIYRNAKLLKPLLGNDFEVQYPKMYPSEADFNAVQDYTQEKYVCLAPTSVWFTKQMYVDNWVELAKKLKEKVKIWWIGSPQDKSAIDKIIELSGLDKSQNLCGKLNILQSAALMQNATMNYTNDSAPAHIATAMDAPVCEIFCSTVPEFGFSALGKKAHIEQTDSTLKCRPCGKHGKARCPEQHFNCGKDIDVERLASYVLQ